MIKPCTSARGVVLVVGSSGSLGKPIAAELRRRGETVRLLGRSSESFFKAGYDPDRWDLKVYAPTSGQREGSPFPCEWFVDVKAVICVARPRWSEPDDRYAFEDLIKRLSTAVTMNGVPILLLLGRPYVSVYTFGMTPNMKAYEKAEMYAKWRFDNSTTGSRLTIARIGEISEIGHLLEIAQRTHVWISVRGYNPRLHPIDAVSFAVAVADFVAEQESESITETPELLVGGKEVITWRDLGALISEELPSKLHFFDIPICVISILLWIFHLCGKIFPFFQGIENVMRITAIPMTADSTSVQHTHIGNCSLKSYIHSCINSGEGGSEVRKHIEAVHERGRS